MYLYIYKLFIFHHQCASGDSTTGKPNDKNDSHSSECKNQEVSFGWRSVYRVI